MRLKGNMAVVGEQAENENENKQCAAKSSPALSFLLLFHPPSLPLPVVRVGCKVNSCLIYEPPSLRRSVQSLATQTDTAPGPHPHSLSFYR